MSGGESIFAVLIFLCAAVGLLLSSRILEGPDRRRRQMFVYYTNLSNAAVAIVHALLFVPGPVGAALRTAKARYFTVLCILVTFIIYFFVLTRFGRHNGRSTLRSLGVRRVSNAFVHYVVPGLTAGEWLTVADRNGLGPRDALEWLAIPLAYFVFLLLRARSGVLIENTQSLWPYTFMDREALGTGKWLRNISLTLLGFYGLALLLLGAAALLR